MLVVRFMGGLGNQLFQLAMYYKLKEDYPKLHVFADLSHYKSNKDHGGFKLSQMTELDYWTKSTKGFSEVTEDSFSDFCDLQDIDDSRNYLFVGYWQEERFFGSSVSKISDLFRRIELTDYLKGILEEIVGSESVAVHVRRGDYVDNFQHGNISTKAYYQNAIDYMCEHVNKPVFFIFSDDLEWCRSNLKFQGEVRFVCSSDEFASADILMMSRCKNAIISNSSFSWWGRKISINEEGINILPPYWYNESNLINSKPLKLKNAIYVKNYRDREKKEEKPFFSILIPAYNVEKYLRRCINSVIDQGFENFEIIIVDDCSADGTKAIVKEYEGADKRISSIEHSANRGLLSARLSGMRVARGKYIILLDGDDYISEDSLGKIYDFLSKDGRSADICELAYVTEPIDATHHPSEKEIDYFDIVADGSYPHTVWNKCYSKSIIDHLLEVVDDFECTYSEDYFFSLMFFAIASNRISFDNVVHHYMLNTGVSTKKILTEMDIEKDIQSIRNIRVNLTKYSSIERRFTENLVKNVVDEASECLFELVYDSDNKACEKLKYIAQIDEAFDTSFSQDLIGTIKELEAFEKQGIKKKVSVTTRYLWKELWKKIGLK